MISIVWYDLTLYDLLMLIRLLRQNNVEKVDSEPQKTFMLTHKSRDHKQGRCLEHGN